jgi:hypothetical protein
MCIKRKTVNIAQMNTMFSQYASSSKENSTILTADLGRFVRQIFSKS